MKARSATFLAILSLVVGCGSDESAHRYPSSASPADLSYDFNLEELEPGQWELRDGVRVCNGYLTRVEDEDFCANSVPEDWKKFDFNGQTYYRVPLRGDDE